MVLLFALPSVALVAEGSMAWKRRAYIDPEVDCALTPGMIANRAKGNVPVWEESERRVAIERLLHIERREALTSIPLGFRCKGKAHEKASVSRRRLKG
jgi:hypothetical protein